MSRQADFSSGVYQPPCIADDLPDTVGYGPDVEASCEECDEGLYLDHLGQWQHVDQGIHHDAEPRMCQRTLVRGSCEDLAVPDGNYCEKHGEE